MSKETGLGALLLPSDHRCRERTEHDVLHQIIPIGMPIHDALGLTRETLFVDAGIRSLLTIGGGRKRLTVLTRMRAPR